MENKENILSQEELENFNKELKDLLTKHNVSLNIAQTLQVVKNTKSE